MLMSAIALSLRQLFDRRTGRLMLYVIALTMAIFAAGGWIIWRALSAWLAHLLSDWLGPGEAGAVALLLTLVLAWFLFRGVAMAVMGLFTDGIIESVEEDHYPDVAARAVPVPWTTGLRMGARSAARAIGWNLLALPAYVLLLVTGVGTLVLMVGVNAIILSRDLEEMAAVRHPALGPRPLDRRRRMMLGLIAAVAFVIPLFNLFAPVFAAALAVHMVHMPKKTGTEPTVGEPPDGTKDLI